MDENPEQAATVTPGQAAYDFLHPNLSPSGFSDLGDHLRARWEGAVEAGSQQQYLYLRSRIDSLTAERDRLTERVAELVTEGNELRARLAELQAHVAAIAQNLEESAAATEPSRKSEIQRDTAQRIREALIDHSDEVWDPCECGEDDTPAVVTSGTEHLAAEITRLAIGGEES